jgi:hypothetical protein
LKAWQRLPKKAKRPSRTCWRKRKTRPDSHCDMLVSQPNGSAFAPMATLRVTCDCGAIYEVIETKGPSREPRPAKCVLCDREMFAWEGDNVGQLRLIWRPDEDRE